jgi:glutamyl-tRNA synthetase
VTCETQEFRRLAVTGKTSGPSLYHLLELLGKDKSLARIEKALAGFWS